MAQLAQAYIHLRPYRASERKLQALGRAAERIALRAAANIYGPGYQIEIELEEGSLRTRVTVVGTILLGAYGVVANYKGLKESAIEMCDDAREFAVDVCKPFVKKAGVAEDDVYRFERRLKTPGKLYRLSKRLERLERSADDLSTNALKRELAKARSDLGAIEADLSESEAKAIEQKLRSERLPPPSQWPEGPEPPKAAKLDDDEEQVPLFDDTTGAAPVGAGGEPSRRIVFRKRSVVPDSKKKRRRKRRERDEPALLPPPRPQR